jgi:hypothetical protein
LADATKGEETMNINKWLWLIILVNLLALTSLPSKAMTEQQKKMRDQLNQLDQLDHLEFTEQMDKAKACIRAHNFACAEKKIAEAAKSAGNSQDKNSLRLAQQNLAAERHGAAIEERQRAEEERQREREERRLAEAERQMEYEQQEAQRQAESASEPSTASQIAQFGALFNQAYSDNLAATREANAEAYRISQQRQASYDADNARRQERFAQQKAQLAADRDRVNSEREERNRLAAANIRAQENERTRQQEQARLQERTRQEEQARKQEQTRKKAEAEAVKLAEQQAQKQASAQYLKSVAAGTRLVATKCPDGEGKYYATGSRPRIKPEVVGCVDVTFRAYCAGSVQYSEGIAHNFIGMAGCFGDTYEISPKPACKVDQVRIEVVEARGGCGG